MNARALADDLVDVTQVLVEATFDTADERVSLATTNGKGTDHGRVGADDGTGGFRIDPRAAHEREVVVDIVAVARIVFRVDDLEIDVRADADAEAFQARLDNARATDQDRPRRPILQQNLRGPQHALVLALGEDDAVLLGALCGAEDRLHHKTGAPDEAVQLVEIGVEILDRPRGHPRFSRGLRDGRRDAQDETRVEGRRDEIVGAEDGGLAAIGAGRDVRDFLARQRGNGLHGGHLHLLVDGAGAAVERSPENIGEADDVVHLVREI